MANQNEVLAKALVMSELKRNGQIGTFKPGKTWTYDGDPTGKEVFTYVESFYLVKVENGSADLSNVSEVIISENEIEGALPFIVSQVDGAQMIMDTGGEWFYVISVTSPVDPFNVGNPIPTGTWIAGSFVRKVTIPETLHPIDPKFLPGVCLPVVEINTVATGEGAALTAEENARMDEVAAMGVPFVLKVSDGESDYKAVAQVIGPSGGNPMFVSTIADVTVAIMNADGSTWTVMVKSVG